MQEAHKVQKIEYVDLLYFNYVGKQHSSWLTCGHSPAMYSLAIFNDFSISSLRVFLLLFA